MFGLGAVSVYDTDVITPACFVLIQNPAVRFVITNRRLCTKEFLV